MRYARRVALQVRLQVDTAGRLLPPILEVEYADAAVGAAGAAATTVPASFSAVYTMDLERFWTGVVVLCVLGAALVLARFSLESSAWTRRNQRLPLDSAFLCRSIASLLNAFGDIFGVLAVALCAYWFVFFKAQAEAFAMLPSELELAPVFLIFVLAVFAKACAIVGLLLAQARADIFLIDWEGTHGTLVDKDGGEGHGDGARDVPVSVWRTIFAANEFAELQVLRQTVPPLTLFLVLLIVGPLGLEAETRALPGGTDRDSTHAASHWALRIAAAAFAWALAWLLQYLVMRFIWRPYVEDQVAQFVDLLSLLNVSVLILDEPYAGYYVHGRSVHAHADTNMRDLHQQLADEANGLTGHRGLSPASEAQTFRVFLTARMRDLYDQRFLSSALSGSGPAVRTVRRGSARRLLTRAPWRPQAARDRTGLLALKGGVRPGGGLARPGIGFRANPEEAAARQSEMNGLLRDFVDGNLEGHDYSIREATYTERLLGLPPDMTMSRESVFTFATTEAFMATCLFGRERDLLFFEVRRCAGHGWAWRLSGSREQPRR